VGQAIFAIEESKSKKLQRPQGERVVDNQKIEKGSGRDMMNVPGGADKRAGEKQGDLLRTRKSPGW